VWFSGDSGAAGPTSTTGHAVSLDGLVAGACSLLNGSGPRSLNKI
jgi:hypothetical protein